MQISIVNIFSNGERRGKHYYCLQIGSYVLALNWHIYILRWHIIKAMVKVMHISTVNILEIVEDSAIIIVAIK